MGVTSKKRDVKNLAGCLREAYLLGAPVRLELGGVALSGVLLFVNESGIGRNAKIESLRIELADPLGEGTYFDPGKVVKIRFVLSKGILEIHGKINDAVGSIYTVVDLYGATIHEARQRSRSQIRNLKGNLALVEGDSFAQVCSFKVTNHSDNSIGGVITTHKCLPETNKIRLSGILYSSERVLSLKDINIVRCVPLASSEGSKTVTYSAAIELGKNKNEKPVKGERRKSQRIFRQNKTIWLRSTMFIHSPIEVVIIDSSAGGFFSQIQSSSDEALLMEGASVVVGEARVPGTIVEKNGNRIRVSFLFENDRQRQHWNEHLRGSLESNLLFNPVDTRSIFSLLTNSGLRDSSYLESAEYLNNLMSSEDIHDSSVISQRWIKQTKNRGPIIHVGAFKVADNVWSMGDLFSDFEGHRGEPEDFTRKFLRSFIEFSSYCSPYPQIIASWKADHSFWKNLTKQINSSKCKFVFSKAKCVTFTPDSRDNRPSSKDIIWNEIKCTEYNKIEYIRQKAEKIGVVDFIDAFDFSNKNFGSPTIRSSLAAQGFKFERWYFFGKLKGLEYLTVASRFPEGLSPQRHQSAIWIFPLSLKAAKSISQDIVYLFSKEAAKYSIFPSVVQVVSNVAPKGFEKKQCHIILADPRVWELM